MEVEQRRNDVVINTSIVQFSEQKSNLLSSGGPAQTMDASQRGRLPEMAHNSQAGHLGFQGSANMPHKTSANHINNSDKVIIDIDDSCGEDKGPNENECNIVTEDGFERDVRAIEELMKKMAIVQEETEIPSSSITVMDPARSKTKGRSKRIKGNKERKNKKKTTNRSKTNQSVEFGSKTPNPRLF